MFRRHNNSHQAARVAPRLGARVGRVGLGLVEAMIALAICSALLTAVAAAFQASAAAINENDEFFRATQTGRVSLSRILTQVRRGTVDNTSTTTSLHLLTDTGTDVRYNYVSSTKKIQMVIRANDVDTTYELARNVTACSFNLEMGTDYAGNSCVSRVAVNITVQVNNNTILLSGTGTSRRNLAYYIFRSPFMPAYNVAGMKYFYGEYDGEEFPTPDKLFAFNNLMDFIMQYGEQALRAIEKMMNDPENEAQSDLLEQLLKDGMLDKDGKGKLRLTPRAVGRMQQKALMEVFSNLRQGQREGHEKVTPGQGGERIEGTKPYQYGDPVSELDLHQTLHNALTRHGLPQRPGSSLPGSSKIKFDEHDFELHLHEGTTSCSTVVLLDMSGSMMRYGRFFSAKKVAMAMQSLIRQRFPQDSIDFVGFYSGTTKIPEFALPLTMPKPVTIYDYQVRLKVPIDKLEKAPQHFTNLHMGLQLARRILRKRPAENKQIFIITDGQPTAHVEGDYVYLLYPPDQRSTVATLKEAVLAVREGCRVSTFALIEDYWGMDWVGFVDQLTKLTKGVAFYTSSGELASCVMESYLSGRKKKAYIA